MISFLLGKPSSGPRTTTTLAANSRLSRGYSAPARRGSMAAYIGTIPVRTHLRGPRTSLCLLDDPGTFATNEEHTKVSRTGQHVARFYCDSLSQSVLPSPLRSV